MLWCYLADKYAENLVDACFSHHMHVSTMTCYEPAAENKVRLNYNLARVLLEIQYQQTMTIDRSATTLQECFHYFDLASSKSNTKLFLPNCKRFHSVHIGICWLGNTLNYHVSMWNIIWEASKLFYISSAQMHHGLIWIKLKEDHSVQDNIFNESLRSETRASSVVIVVSLYCLLS